MKMTIQKKLWIIFILDYKLDNIMFNKYTFAVVEIKPHEFKKGTAINSGLIFRIQLMFWLRFRLIKYFEPLTCNGKNFLVFGSCKANKGSVNRNVFIFMMELTNEVKSKGEHKISRDFPYIIKKYKDYKIKLYSIKKFNFKKEYTKQLKNKNK